MTWRQSHRSTTGYAAQHADLPRWVVLSGTALLSLAIILLLRFAIDVAGMVCILMVTGFGVRAASDWFIEGDSTAGWALGGVALGMFGTVVVGAWLFGSANIGTELIFHNKVTRRLIAAVDWAEAHGWGQRALLAGGPLDRARSRELTTGAAQAGVIAAGSPSILSQERRHAASVRATAARSAERSRPGAEARPAESAEEAALASTAATAVVTREPIATTVVLGVRPATSRVGMSVRLTAAVSSDSEALVEGSVVFRRDDVVLGKVPLRPSPWTSSAYLIVLDLPLGTHSLAAEFSGAGSLSPSRSLDVPVTITR